MLPFPDMCSGSEVSGLAAISIVHPLHDMIRHALLWDSFDPEDRRPRITRTFSG